jgi:hypothetical protein
METPQPHVHTFMGYKLAFWFLLSIIWTVATFITGLATGIVYKDKEPQVMIENWHASGNLADVPKKGKPAGVGGGG